ncbi:MAG: hypothetical protein JHD35_19880 [Sphingopyxis sp.]|nr:hypothetical protein [Sphingopyxis sp.]
MLIDLELEIWRPSPVIRMAGRGYSRIPAARFTDAAARLTPRQGVFYRNLVRIAEVIGTSVIPVDFANTAGERFYLDRGCIRIAELAKFVAPLVDDENGVVSSITLGWTA